MTINLSHLQVRLSGGAANTSQLLSLGGAMSTAADGLVKSQAGAQPTTLTGVVIDYAAGNNEGNGTLSYVNSAKTLRWTPPGGSAGSTVNVSAGGQFAIQGGNEGGFIVVTVSAASLPGQDLTNTIAITNLANQMFDNVSKQESLDGAVEYRCFYLHNAHGSEPAVNIKLWIDANTPGQDVIAIALDPAGKNGVPTAVASETDAPAGVGFDAANPVSEATSLAIGTLNAGEFYPFWIRRTVPANTTTQTLNNSFRLAFRVFL